jgi:hypothetical protein
MQNYNQSRLVNSEYIIFYTSNLKSPEREWLMSSVKGDRLSILIRELQPSTTYHFKLQARNVKGYGPFSQPISFTTAKNARVHDLFERNGEFSIEKYSNSNSTLYDQAIEMIRLVHPQVH